MKARPAIFEQQYRDSYQDHRLFENLNGNYYFSKLPFRFPTWNGKLEKCNMRKIKKDLCAMNELAYNWPSRAHKKIKYITHCR